MKTRIRRSPVFTMNAAKSWISRIPKGKMARVELAAGITLEIRRRGLTQATHPPGKERAGISVQLVESF